MKTWRETSAVFAEIERQHEQGRAIALATLVRYEGTIYRRLGFRVLFRDDGTMLFASHGGRLADDLRRHALNMMALGDPPELLSFATGNERDVVWGLSIGPRTTADFFLQVLTPENLPAEVLSLIRERFDGIEMFAIRTVIDGPDAGRIVLGPPFTDEKTGIVVEDGHRVFVHHLDPPPDLVIVGAGDDAIPLARYASDIGFRVTVVDHRPDALDRGLFPNAHRLICATPDRPDPRIPARVQTYALLMTCDDALDRDWALFFAASATPYIGLMGGRERHNRIAGDLPEPVRQRLRGTIGLEIGAKGSEQGAVSILAEVIAVESGYDISRWRRS